MRLLRNRIRPIDRLERRDLLSAVVVESEPNNRASAADVAVLDPADQAATLTGRISARNDQDFFRFTAPASGAVHLTVESGAGLRGRVSVEDSRGVKMMETEPNDGINSGDFNATAGTTYFVRVRSKDNTVGNYRVNVDLNPPAAAVAAAAAPAAVARSQAVDAVLSSGASLSNSALDDSIQAVAAASSARRGGGADDPANHDAGDDRGRRRGGRGADDAPVLASARRGRGADDPANHDATDDRGRRRGGRGADDGVGHT